MLLNIYYIDIFVNSKVSFSFVLTTPQIYWKYTLQKGRNDDNSAWR